MGLGLGNLGHVNVIGVGGGFANLERNIGCRAKGLALAPNPKH